MSRDSIKYIAMLAMLLNHIGHIFLEAPLSTVFIDIGYFTAITMCCFLVEGYRYTRSPKRYALRLLIFALLSQIPYSLAFTKGRILEFDGCNVLFNLLLCFIMIHVFCTYNNTEIRLCTVFILTGLSSFCDWSVLAPVFTLLFLWAGQERKRQKEAWLYAVLAFGFFEILGKTGTEPFWRNLMLTLGAMAGPAAAGCCILFAYNGKRIKRFRRFSQWFFYLFYPVHLLILGLLRCFCETYKLL